MIEPRQEPRGLRPNARPIADISYQVNHREDAIRGSLRLKEAILRTRLKSATRAAKKLRSLPELEKSWPARKLARQRTNQVIRTAAEYFGLTIFELLGPRGPCELSRKRQITMYAARYGALASLPVIGYCFKRDHTTVLHACRLVEADADAKAHADAIRELFAA
jgi:chromosomal replication initiation ATPase DnaA